MSKMTKTEINRGIQEVFEKCLDLIYLYEPTGCYNRVPEGAVETDISEYMDNWFADIRTAIRTIFESNKDVAESLMQIVTEFEFFARSCEVPGVVDRWRQLNPSIQYFDTAFDLVDCAPEVYEKISMGLTNLKLKCYPTEGIICERNLYFERAKHEQEGSGRTYSEEFAFQEELRETLKWVLRNDCGKYV